MTDASDDETLRSQLEALHLESWGWALACCAADARQAEEVLQMTYLKVLEGRARFTGRSQFKTWLFGVIRLTAVDQRRWDWRRWLRWAPEEDAELQQAHESPADELLDQRERCEEVRSALSQLSTRQEQVLRLVFYHELTLDDAARIMAVSPGSARTHYERGKAQLRALLAGRHSSP